jgi:hypothetical protein
VLPSLSMLEVPHAQCESADKYGNYKHYSTVLQLSPKPNVLQEKNGIQNLYKRPFTFKGTISQDKHYKHALLNLEHFRMAYFVFSGYKKFKMLYQITYCRNSRNFIVEK